jgi:CBS domain-containing protein
MEVKKIMTKNPACCTPDSTLEEVAHMMEMYDCGCIPVVEDHKTNKPVGTITDRDIAVRSFGENRNPLEMKASDIMTTDVATVTPEMTVEQARDVMETRQIRRILVVDNSGRCVGIVAQADLAQNETNARQTAEFVRDVSQPSHSGQQYQQQQNYQSQRGAISSERESYRNFANQDRKRERDFSMSEESRNRSTSKREKKTRTREERSFFGSSLLVPLVVGIGAGAALKYFMPSEEKSQTTFVPREAVTSSVHKTVDTTPDIMIEIPVEKNSLRVDTSDAIGAAGNLTASNIETDADATLEIGQTARL